MGSLPDSKYIIKTDGYWFVEAHDVDPSKGYISVSAKGIVNGLSNQPNDGCDFGPDTYNPNYSGSGVPYTQTSGIQEALNYVNNNIGSSVPDNGEVNFVAGGYYVVDQTITIPVNGNQIPPRIKGNNSHISPSTSFNTSDTLIELSTKSSGSTRRLYISNIHFSTGYGYGTATNVLDISQNELDTQGSILDNLYFTNETTPSGYVLKTDGNENLMIQNCLIGGNVSLLAVGGTLFIENTYIGTGSTQSPLLGAQILSLHKVTFEGNSPTFTQGTNSMSAITIVDCYSDGTSGTGYFLIEGGSTTTDFYVTIQNYWANGNNSYFFANTNTTKVKVYASFHNVSGLPSAFSSGDTANLNLYVMTAKGITSRMTVNSTVTTTPSVPTSGTAQSNTNPYPVNVYLYGGTVTVIDYTPSGGSATQVGTSGPATVRLNPGDSITLTYSGTPTWNWVAV